MFTITTKFSLKDIAYVVDTRSAEAYQVTIDGIYASFLLPDTLPDISYHVSLIPIIAGVNSSCATSFVTSRNVWTESCLYTASEAKTKITQLIIDKTNKISGIS